MNTKIPLRQFAEAFAQKASVSVADAEGFIRLVFETAAAELRTGSVVKIKGLGTFSLSRNDADPVAFEPDSSFAADVNAPFAMFEPVVLADGMTDDMLSEIDRECAPQQQPAEEEPAEKEPAQEPVQVIEPEPQPEPEPEPQPEPEPESLPVVEEPAQEEPTAEDEPTVVETAVEEPTVEEPAAEPVAESKAEPEAEEEQPEEVAAPAPQWEYEEEEYVEQSQETKSRFGAGFVAGLIVGLAIGALALCAYVLYYVNSGSEEEPVDTEIVTSQPESY